MSTVEYVRGPKVRQAKHARGCRKRGAPTCGGAFVCGTCKKLVGWCQGAWDAYPDDCDGCANRKSSTLRL